MKETFGKWLKRKRKERGLNQPELAKLAHTTKATISLLEADKIAQPRLENIDNIAKSLAIPIEEMRQIFAEKFIIKNGAEFPKVPKVILEALAREGELLPNDDAMIADFIIRLKQAR